MYSFKSLVEAIHFKSKHVQYKSLIISYFLTNTGFNRCPASSSESSESSSYSDDLKNENKIKNNHINI